MPSSNKKRLGMGKGKRAVSEARGPLSRMQKEDWRNFAKEVLDERISLGKAEAQDQKSKVEQKSGSLESPEEPDTPALAWGIVVHDVFAPSPDGGIATAGERTLSLDREIEVLEVEALGTREHSPGGWLSWR